MIQNFYLYAIGAMAFLSACAKNEPVDVSPSPPVKTVVPQPASADPDAAQKAFQLAKADARESRFNDALKHLNQAIAANPTLAEAVGLRAEIHEVLGNHAQSSDDYLKLITLVTPSASLQMQTGSSLFFAGRIKASIQAFDKAIELRPDSAAHNWQRGISLYYAGRFKDGRLQFEIHRKVNPHDVENAAWHYLCHAREKDPKTAAKHLIPINTQQDTRIPMAQVYDLFAGKGHEKTVMAAAQKNGRKQAFNYAHLYLGLWHEAHGRHDEAAQHMQLAAEKYFLPNYMGQVSRVHWTRLQKTKAK